METKVFAGKILISAPAIGDVFNRSVILTTENNDNGTVGFILNKKLNYRLKDVVETFSLIDAPVYLGGPVQTELVSVIHRLGDKIGGYEISERIYYSCDVEKLNELAENNLLNQKDIRFFVGYSGWGKGQLSNEIKNNAWFISQGNERYVFDTNAEDLWSIVLKDMGSKYKIISTFPKDPSLN
jgi:putative transcriptional regulator